MDLVIVPDPSKAASLFLQRFKSTLVLWGSLECLEKFRIAQRHPATKFVDFWAAWNLHVISEQFGILPIVGDIPPCSLHLKKVVSVAGIEATDDNYGTDVRYRGSIVSRQIGFDGRQPT